MVDKIELPATLFFVYNAEGTRPRVAVDEKGNIQGLLVFTAEATAVAYIARFSLAMRARIIPEPKDRFLTEVKGFYDALVLDWVHPNQSKEIIPLANFK